MKLLEYIRKSKLYYPPKNIVLYRGVSNPKILFVGENPDKEENLKGIPFLGKSGKMLDSWIREYRLQKYVGMIYAIPLIPLNVFGGVRNPYLDEIDYFRPYVEYMVEKLQPKIIICVGNTACRSVLKSNVGSMRHHLTKKGKYFYTAVYHPTYYLRKGLNGLEDFKNTYIEISAVLENLPQIKIEPSEKADIDKILKN